MTTYSLTISTAALGLGILSNARVTVRRKRTVVSDVFPSTNITSQETVTNVSGIATILLAADDGTVFHEVRIHNSRDMVIYFKAFKFNVKKKHPKMPFQSNESKSICLLFSS